METNKNTTLIYKYNILANGRHVETNLLGWRTALAHARNHRTNLFETNIVEILNLSTGEIVTLEQAEKCAIRRTAQSIVDTI